MKKERKKEITLVISVYKDLEALKLILHSLELQSNKEFNVIIAEDNNSKEINTFVSTALYSFNLLLIQQEDLGFRKNKALNTAIRNLKTPYVAFIDGDCICHKHFIKEHLRVVKKGFASVGRRVNMGEDISSSIRKNKNVSVVNSFFKMLFSDSKRVGEGFYFPLDIEFKKKKRGLLGCNWAVSVDALKKVNGYDEDFVDPSIGEDSDIDWRLRAVGQEFKSVKNKAIVCHLWHKENYNQSVVDFNYEIMKNKQDTNEIYAKNGLVKP